MHQNMLIIPFHHCWKNNIKIDRKSEKNEEGSIRGIATPSKMCFFSVHCRESILSNVNVSSKSIKCLLLKLITKLHKHIFLPNVFLYNVCSSLSLSLSLSPSPSLSVSLFFSNIVIGSCPTASPQPTVLHKNGFCFKLLVTLNMGLAVGIPFWKV